MNKQYREDSENNALAPETVDDEQASETADRKGRRKFLVGAAVSTPVILSIVSRPALGGACTVSGFLSGNLSNPHAQEICGGRSPGYWINHLSDTTTKYADVFGGVWYGRYGAWDANTTLYQALAMTGNEDRYQFGAHSVAAYLNAVDPGIAYSMTPTEVINIVSDVLVLGQYTHPGTGRVMDAQEVVDFFFGTFDG